jgi:hypothetical protein
VLVQEGAHCRQKTAAVLRLGKEQFGLARKAADVGEKPAPKPPRLPPAVIGGVVAEAEKQRKRHAEDGERGRLDMGKRQDIAVDADDGGGEEAHGQQLRRDDRQDRTPHREQKRDNPGFVAQDHVSACQPWSERQRRNGLTNQKVADMNNHPAAIALFKDPGLVAKPRHIHVGLARGGSILVKGGPGHVVSDAHDKVFAPDALCGGVDSGVGGEMRPDQAGNLGPAALPGNPAPLPPPAATDKGL